MPLALTDGLNLITRPVFQLMNSTPYVNESGNLHRVTGFGDTILATMLSPSPKLAGPWLLSLGPTFIFPTASNSCLGQNKWQIGPAGVFGCLGDKWLAGVFPNSGFSRRTRLTDGEPDEYSILCRLSPGRRMGNRNLAQHSGELVRGQVRRHDYFSRWLERLQGGQDRFLAREAAGPGSIHAGPS